MRRFLHENGLSLVIFGITVLCLAGQSVAGLLSYNHEQQAHGQPLLDYLGYLRSGHFIESVFENWESEFLQMGAFVLLTISLRQKGSSESAPLDESEPEEPSQPSQPRQRPHEPAEDDRPWPVRRGGLALRLYEHSLTIALFLLFVVSFALHGVGGAKEYNDDRRQHGQPLITTGQYLCSARFWFESLQNWQSEFLSVGALVVLSIFLRQKGSPQSKKVDAPHHKTGS